MQRQLLVVWWGSCAPGQKRPGSVTIQGIPSYPTVYPIIPNQTYTHVLALTTTYSLLNGDRTARWTEI